MKKIIITLMILSLIGIVNAVEYNKDVDINIPLMCNIAGSIPSSSATFQVTIINPYGNTVVDNESATALGEGRFNYTYKFLTTGTYTLQEACIDGTESYSNTEEIEIIGVDNPRNRTVSDTMIGLALALGICVLCYLKVSRFLGSMGIFVSGMGMLFMVSENGWIGYIIMASGFLMMLYALMTPSKRRRF